MIIMDPDTVPGRSSPDTTHHTERTLWVTHPSPAALAPEILLSIVLIVFVFPRSAGITQWIIDQSHMMIPWTQVSVDRFFTMFRAALFVPLLITLIRALALRITRYELTTQRLKICRGLLVRRHDEIGLHRIRDYKVMRPVLGLFLGYGAVRIISRDPSLPVLDMNLIPDAKRKTEDIRTQALSWKKTMGYREFDTGELS